jgi:hypothetical protein
MNSRQIFVLFMLGLSLTGCASYITKEEFAPDMYAEHPVSILVLPPINKTTAADAKEYYATTVAEPLTNSGYYVFPMEVVYDILQQEGLFDTETMLNVPVQKYREYFDADAVLYVTLLEWDTQYFITSGSVTVKAACELKSTRTGNAIWFYDEAVTVSTTGESGGASGLAGLIAQVITTAIKTATQSYIPLARDASEKIFLAMPYGKYHKKYEQDRKEKVEKKKSQAEREKK